MNAMGRNLKLFCALVITIVAYSATYSWRVLPLGYKSGGIWGYYQGTFPAYRFGGEMSEIVFRPANWVDQKLRPDFWVNGYVTFEETGFEFEKFSQQGDRKTRN